MMSVYVILQLEIHDPDGFGEYREQVSSQISKTAESTSFEVPRWKTWKAPRIPVGS
jgi:hypothetical protein